MSSRKKTIHLYTTETISDKKITKSCGMVNGSIVNSRNIIRDIGAGLKNIVGGEIKTYTNLLQNSRKIVIE